MLLRWAQEARFYCTTSNHKRVLHFKTPNANVLENALVGGQHTSASDWRLILAAIPYVCLDVSLFSSSGTTKLSGHTAYLPDATTHTSQSDGFVGYHTFFKHSHYHWHIRGYGDRFECDDWSHNFNFDTIHRVFVRN